MLEGFVVLALGFVFHHILFHAPSPSLASHEYSQSAPIVMTLRTHDGNDQIGVVKLPSVLGKQTTNYFHASKSQAENIELAAQRLNGTVIDPGKTFSYYAVVGPYTEENGFGWGRAFVGDRIVPSVGGGVCQGSSTLYSAILRTGLNVLERHQHGLTVPYLPPGEDATVAGDYLNFQFQNNRKTPVAIIASAKNRHMTVEIMGASPGPAISIHHKILQTYPFRTIVHYRDNLKPGEEKILAPGQVGVRVQNWLDIQEKNGIMVKQLGIDTYRPSPRIIEKGEAAKTYHQP